MKISAINVNPQSNTLGTDSQIKELEIINIPSQTTEVNTNEQANNISRMPSDAKEIMNDEMLQKSVDQANKSLSTYNRRIERSVHEVTHTVMYLIRNTDTNEVIREFPSKKIQDMIAKMWEMAGLFVDEKA